MSTHSKAAAAPPAATPAASSSKPPASPSLSPTSCQSASSVSIWTHHELLPEIPLVDVRNVCLIAHIDHGKSSLSSRLLELAGNITNSAANNNATNNREQIEVLDTLLVEQQRGITVKASSASMLVPHETAIGPHGLLLINLMDTPGHVDFQTETRNTLRFVQGAVLLLDATQGVQAQTWSVWHNARDMQVPVLVALTKLDLPHARPATVALQVAEWLHYEPNDIVYTSARTNQGVPELLDAICRHVPSPPPPPSPHDDNGVVTGGVDGAVQASVIDSLYDDRGVRCLVQVQAGALCEGDKVTLLGNNNHSPRTLYSVQEVGIVTPRPLRTKRLGTGQLGYVRFGLRDPRQAGPGTMMVDAASSPALKVLNTAAHHQLQSQRSVLYASVHPQDTDGFDELARAVERLALNDTGLEMQRTGGSSHSSKGGPFLGPGLKVGFQGLLHCEVFRQRLRDEFALEAIVTPPQVPYKVMYHPSRSNNVSESYSVIVEDLADWPAHGTKFTVDEPMVQVTIVAPVAYAGAVMDLLTARKRGQSLATQTLDEGTWMFTATLPWAEVVMDMHDQLKNVTAGYGSLDTQPAEPPYAAAALHKVDITLNGETVAPLSFVAHVDAAQAQARVVVHKLQAVLPRQQFVTIIQARAAGKIIAAERIQAYRKDVLTKSGKVVGGGDQTRKMKLVQKQKKGKKRMQQTGRVQLSQEAFNSVIARST